MTAAYGINISYNYPFPSCLKAGFYLKAVFMAEYYGFNANISFTFQAVKNLSTHPIFLCFRLFCEF